MRRATCIRHTGPRWARRVGFAVTSVCAMAALADGCAATVDGDPGSGDSTYQGKAICGGICVTGGLFAFLVKASGSATTVKILGSTATGLGLTITGQKIRDSSNREVADLGDSASHVLTVLMTRAAALTANAQAMPPSKTLRFAKVLRSRLSSQCGPSPEPSYWRRMSIESLRGALDSYIETQRASFASLFIHGFVSALNLSEKEGESTSNCLDDLVGRGLESWIRNLRRETGSTDAQRLLSRTLTKLTNYRRRVFGGR